MYEGRADRLEASEKERPSLWELEEYEGSVVSLPTAKPLLARRDCDMPERMHEIMSQLPPVISNTKLTDSIF